MITSGPGEEEPPNVRTDPHPKLQAAFTRSRKAYGNFEVKEKSDPDPIGTVKDVLQCVRSKILQLESHLKRISEQKILG